MTAPVLQVEHLSKQWAAQAVLRDISLQLHPGELLGLIGANGSGKSTLLRCLAGLLPMDKGDALIRGYSIGREPLQARSHLGYAVVR